MFVSLKIRLPLRQLTDVFSGFVCCGKELVEGRNVVLQPQILAGGFPSNPTSKITGNWTGKKLYFIRILSKATYFKSEI